MGYGVHICSKADYVKVGKTWIRWASAIVKGRSLICSGKKISAPEWEECV